MLNKLKNKKLTASIISILVLSFLLSPCVINLYKSNFSEQVKVETKYSPKILFGDLDFLIKTAKEVHPNLYANISEGKFEEELSKVKSQLNSPLTRKEFLLIIAPLISKIDGHSAIYTPEVEVSEYLNNGGKLFPYDILLTANSISIVKDYTSDQQIPLGTEITSINKIPTKEILEKLLQYESRETEAGKLAELSVRFKTRLWLVFGFGNEFEIEVDYSMLGIEKFNKYKISGVNKKTLDEQLETISKYSYKTLDNKTGILELKSFTDSGTLDKFLKETFTKIQNDKVEKLIIDIRNNGGGNYVLGEKIINYISDKNYKLVDKQEIKASTKTKRYLKQSYFPCFLCNIPVENFSNLTNKVWDTKDGGSATLEFEETKYQENKLRFTGKTYFATSSFTYSSAAVFANAIKQYNLGTLIGEETGGLGEFYSDPYKFKLPNTQLEIGISYRKFYLPGGTNSPIKPDILIETKVEDLINKKDSVIEFVLTD